MKLISLTSVMIMLLANSYIVRAQESSVTAQEQDESRLKISGELLTDERFLLNDKKDWSWNENRLTMRLDKKITNSSKFYSEVWLRNIGLPNITSSGDLYNKGIVDPYNLEIREAYV
jgi:hypothetical protein